MRLCSNPTDTYVKIVFTWKLFSLRLWMCWTSFPQEWLWMLQANTPSYLPAFHGSHRSPKSISGLMSFLETQRECGWRMWRDGIARALCWTPQTQEIKPDWDATQLTSILLSTHSSLHDLERTRESNTLETNLNIIQCIFCLHNRE